MPSVFRSRCRVTVHPCAETAATVKESVPFPTLASVCANTTAVPAAPTLVRGGCRSVPPTWPTTRSDVSEEKMYGEPESTNETYAHDTMCVPAGVPCAESAGAASAEMAKRRAATSPVTFRPRAADRPPSTIKAPRRIGSRSLVDADPQLERGACCSRQYGSGAGVVRGHILTAHVYRPTSARARRDVRHLRGQCVSHLHARRRRRPTVRHGDPVADDLPRSDGAGDRRDPVIEVRGLGERQ